MALVATINGVQVHSDKVVMQIFDTRVEFVDGSWCDVSTGQVVNRGRGEINIGSPTSGGETTTKGPTQYSDLSNLELRQVTADVTVEPHEAEVMELTITGPENEVEKFNVSVQGRTLVIEGGPEAGGGTSISTSGGRTVIRGGRGVFVTSRSRVRQSFGGSMSIVTGSSAGGSNTKVTLKVPYGTPIQVTSDSGDTRIGDVHGPLKAHVIGDGDVNAGRMTDVELFVQGIGDIRVAEVNGSATAQVQGTGDISIDDGTITSLTATVQGTGDVTVGGVAQRASLSVMGTGDIRVDHVVEPPIRSAMGTGDIRVRRVG